MQSEIEKLKAWSDLGDHYLQEQVDATSQALDRLQTVINEMYDADTINERIEELKEEEEKPVDQLLMEFIEKNATEQQKEEMRNPKG